AVDLEIKAPISTTTTLQLPQDVVLGQGPYAIEATVTAVSGTPNGSILFQIGSADPVLVPLDGGTAALDWMPTATGTIPVTATYLPGTGFAASAAVPASIEVAAPPIEAIATTTTLSIDPDAPT